MINKLYHEYHKQKKTKELLRLKNKMERYRELLNPSGLIVSSDFFPALEGMGVTSGDNILLRVALRAGQSYEGGLNRLYQDFFDYVDTAGGNVLSLSYTFDKSPLMYLAENHEFSKTMPTTTGLPNEIFRRHIGVERSIHPTHSVSVYGKSSREIVATHHLDPYTYSDKSPFYHVFGHTRGKEVIIGLNHMSVAQHFIEDQTHPESFIDSNVMARVVLHNGDRADMEVRVENPFIKKTGGFSSGECIEELFKENILQQVFVKGVSVYVYDSKRHAEKLVELAQKNICQGRELRLKTFVYNQLIKRILLATFFDKRDNILFPKRINKK
jgi:aminoglycoside 3-N-acetyltransferase